MQVDHGRRRGCVTSFGLVDLCRVGATVDLHRSAVVRPGVGAISQTSRPTCVVLVAAACVELVAAAAAPGPLVCSLAQPTKHAGSDDPFALVIGSFATDVVALIAAYGALRRQRWGVIALIVVQSFWALQAGVALVDGDAVLGATMLCVTLFCIWCCLDREDLPASSRAAHDAGIEWTQRVR